MCFSHCGGRWMSCAHRFCVSQRPLHWVPPGVRRQGRLCWWIGRSWLRWVEMINRSLLGEQKDNFETGLQTRSFHLSISFFLADKIISSPGACNFNMEGDQWKERCQLSQDPDDDFDWRIGSSTETPGAGPITDHSQGLQLLSAKILPKIWPYTTRKMCFYFCFPFLKVSRRFL